MQGEDDDDAGEPVFVRSAGLVLAAAFLPRLFGALSWLTPHGEERPRLRDEDTVSRACHLLQWMVDGRTDAPEPSLALHKVLCGVPPATPVDREITLTDEESALGERVLRSILHGWPPLASTSLAGLRETFLRREGKLVPRADRWVLRVDRRTVDVLLDQIPWSFSVVLNPWMPSPLHVRW